MRRFITYYKFIIGKLRSLFSSRKFIIKKGYRHRKSYVYYDAIPLTDEYQNEIYEITHQYLVKYELNNVIDIGCGSAFKLLKYFDKYNTVGLEVTESYKKLINIYPDKIWINIDEFMAYSKLTGDIVICADVIEHVLDPELLLKQIKEINDFKYLFLSTPERDIVRGFLNYGPPSNKHHIREWNGREFRSFVSLFFQIEKHLITNYADGTQLLICTKHI